WCTRWWREPHHVSRLVQIRGPSPAEKLDAVSAFNPRHGGAALDGREQTGTAHDGGEEPIPEVLRIGVEQRQRLGRPKRSRQLTSGIVGGGFFCDLRRGERGERQFRERPIEQNGSGEHSVCPWNCPKPPAR